MRMAIWRRRLVLPAVALMGAVALGAEDPQLVAAAKSADWETMRTALAQGADVAAQQSDGTTALHWAA